jgi:hypothetical protein
MFSNDSALGKHRLLGRAMVACLLFVAASDLGAEGQRAFRPRHRLRRAHARSLQLSDGTVIPLAIAPPPPPDPPEVTIGERLFLETGFAQYFAAHFSGDVNKPLSQGDPTVNHVQTTAGKFPGPFAGQSMNCRSCHFVDELGEEDGGGNRTYADFTRRSPVPAREDGHTTVPRNALNLTIGRFKTPTLRDLGHSQPYLHTGRMDSVEKVLDFYRHTALLAQAGQLRNADPNIAGISIDAQDSAALAAFLASLNEDYD